MILRRHLNGHARPRTKWPGRASPVWLTVFVILLAGACGGTAAMQRTAGGDTVGGGATIPSAQVPQGAALPSSGASDAPATALTPLPDSARIPDSPRGITGFSVAPTSARIDLYEPTFSDPTTFTNPLFPIGRNEQVIQLGVEEGKPVRVEFTLLPGTKIIEVNGEPVVNRVVQFVAYLDGEIVEVALDYHAQADDGSVWYLGEHVFNYEDGAVVDYDGTWLAGKDGPPAMIMPTDPQVGDVYRPEDIPGSVFEEVTVRAVDQIVERGPAGPVEGVLLVEELHMDGTTEPKAFAPGYGEFLTHDENAALAVPTDALGGEPPAELGVMSAAVADILDAVLARRWQPIAGASRRIAVAWDTYRKSELPPLLKVQMRDAVHALANASHARDMSEVGRTASYVGLAALDFALRHRSLADVDIARLDVWARRLMVDAMAADAGRVASDVSILEWVWRRVGHMVAPAEVNRIDSLLVDLRAAADAAHFRAASRGADRLRGVLADLLSTG